MTVQCLNNLTPWKFTWIFWINFVNDSETKCAAQFNTNLTSKQFHYKIKKASKRHYFKTYSTKKIIGRRIKSFLLLPVFWQATMSLWYSYLFNGKGTLSNSKRVPLYYNCTRGFAWRKNPSRASIVGAWVREQWRKHPSMPVRFT